MCCVHKLPYSQNSTVLCVYTMHSWWWVGDACLAIGAMTLHLSRIQLFHVLTCSIQHMWCLGCAVLVHGCCVCFWPCCVGCVCIAAPPLTSPQQQPHPKYVSCHKTNKSEEQLMCVVEYEHCWLQYATPVAMWNGSSAVTTISWKFTMTQIPCTPDLPTLAHGWLI
jgi:hypothetical protein